MKKTHQRLNLMGAVRSATGATLLLLGLASPGISRAASPYLPVPITSTSYNQDAIVESNATPRLDVVTTATVDQGTNNGANTWFEVGYDLANPGNGLPAAGSVYVAVDNANYSFRAPPTYVGPNGILIDTVVTSGTFTLTTPAAYNLLSFVGSGGNGGDVIAVRVNHQDGSFEVGSFGCPDWFGGTGIAFIAGGRCQSPVTFTTEVDGGTPANPRIYFRDVALTNTTSPVTSIVLSYQSGNANSHNDVLGVSGATTPGGPVGPITVTGYTYDFVVEASAAKRGRVVSQVIVDTTNVFATTVTMDSDLNTGFTFYEKGHDFNMINNGPVTPTNPVVTAIAQASGIPVHGTSFTNAAGNHAYTMAPDYTTNDVVWVSPVYSNSTITLTTPAAYTALSFLCAAGNGPVNPIVIVHHQNGGSETNVIKIVDWFDSSPPMFIPNGRVQAESGQWSQQTFQTNGADRLFATDFLVNDTASPVTTIDLVYTNTGGRAGIFAVAGNQGPVTPIITQQPTGTNTFAGNPISFSVSVIGTPPFTYQWQKGTNGVYVNLSNGGNISGATTATLVINPADYFADAADYRVIVSNGGGSVTSGVATANLISTLADVTQPGDPITFFGGGLFGDGAVAQAIDNNLGAKWGANVNLPANVGCVVTPSVGATLVTGLRLYTANDAPERDPANYRLEGSINGGASYTLIASNLVTMPDGRNATGGVPDPILSFVREVSFPNTNGYISYRLSFTQLKGGAGQGSFQLGEVELLGVTTNLPLVVSVPSTAKAFNGNPVSIAATVTGSPAPTSRWQKQVGLAFVNLTDGGTISGSQTPTLTINPAVFSDAGNYRIIATNTVTAVTSAPVVVTIYDTNLDVTVASDPITDFGNITTTPATPTGAIDDIFSTFTSRGSGLNANAGFPPWGAPVGLIVTPQAGPTLVTALRIYTGGDGSVSDPADVKLEGSNNGGASYTTIVPKTALSLPDDRNANLFAPIDPTLAAVQELRFANSQAYTSYRLTFEHLKDDGNTYFISIGEMELLGVAVPTGPVISSTVLSGGNLLLSGSGGAPNGSYSVLTNANIAAPVVGWGTNTTSTFDGSGNFSLSLPISAANPRLFYLIKQP